MSSSDSDPGSMSGGSVCTGYLVWVGIVGNLAFVRVIPCVGSIGDGSSVGNLVWAGSIVGNDFAHMVPDKGSYGSIVVHMVLVDKGPCGIYSMVCIVCLGNCSCFCISA